MKLIVRNGTTTKHTPLDTFDSLLLAIHTDYIDGVEVNLNMTKDQKIVIYQTDSIENHPLHKISNLTLLDLQKYNLGSRVKKHTVLILEEVLKLFQTTSKLLVLNLNNHGSNNKDFIQAVLTHVEKYPNDNIYIKSPCKEIVLEMKDKIGKARMGAVITDSDPYFWNLNLDFYSISVQKTNISECSSHIQEQLENHHFIMMGDIYDSEIYGDVKSSIGDGVMDSTYIITSNVVNLAKDYYPN